MNQLQLDQTWWERKQNGVRCDEPRASLLSSRQTRTSIIEPGVKEKNRFPIMDFHPAPFIPTPA